MKGLRVSILLAIPFLLTAISGCNQVRVDRWSDLERPCQPHGFYIAPKGDRLTDVASTCKTDERILRKYNGWLTTRQPFVEPTVVWLKQNPMVQAGDEDLAVEELDTSRNSGLVTESLAPLRLPKRSTVAK